MCAILREYQMNNKKYLGGMPMCKYRKIINLSVRGDIFRVEVEEDGRFGHFKIRIINTKNGEERVVWKDVKYHLDFIQVIKSEIWYRFFQKHYGFEDFKADQYEQIGKNKQ